MTAVAPTHLTAARATGPRVAPRMLHPVAWWVWAIGLATAAAHTTNPWLLLLVITVAAWVTLQRRELGGLDALLPFLVVGFAVIALRVGLTVVLGNGIPGRITLLELPQVHLPDWAAGLRLGGRVTLESVVAAAVDGLRLAATLACFGAANALASPRRLLRYAPATLYDIGTALVVGLTFAPQLVELAGRVRAARQLRGHSGRGLRELARLVVPVLDGALDRSLDLAASMESRGYGRIAVRSGRERLVGSALALGGATGVVGGVVGVLTPAVGGSFGWPLLVAGVLLLGASLVVGARRDVRTAYRRDPWRWPECLTVLLGGSVAAALVSAEARGISDIAMTQVPLEWPTVPTWPALAILAAGLVGILTPIPPRLALARARRTTVETA